ncbi:MAG: HAD family hydrolase [Acidobacteriota bacterium]
MPPAHSHAWVSLIDVDNTLIDNDKVAEDLRRHLEDRLGTEARNRYWEIFEDLRQEIGYADYLGAMQRYRLERPREPRLLETSLFLIDYPFASRLYAGALDVIARLTSMGPVVVFSDGDAVFQPRKVWRSGLWAAVDGHVLIYVHKEEMLDDVEARYPAAHYALIDDKLRILTAVKAIWQDRVTTVFPRQGHYALDAQASAIYPPADVTIAHIGELAPTEAVARYFPTFQSAPTGIIRSV